jgi:hypothetical protein
MKLFLELFIKIMQGQERIPGMKARLHRLKKFNQRLCKDFIIVASYHVTCI